MRQFEPQLNPAAAGIVHARDGRYGKRGGLTTFVARAIRSASEPISTAALTMRGIAHFGLTFGTSQDRDAFRHRVAEACHSLKSTEQISQIKNVKGTRSSYWRWGQALPSFAELAQASAEASDGQAGS
jgi:hypothetical protein